MGAEGRGFKLEGSSGMRVVGRTEERPWEYGGAGLRGGGPDVADELAVPNGGVVC